LKDYDVEIIHTDNNEGYMDESLSSRLAKYKTAKVDAFVSIHHNAFGDGWNNATGVEVYVDKKATVKDMKLAQCVYDRLVKYTGLKGRGIKKENFYVINQNTIPAILVEGGFMTNKKDYQLIASDVGQNAYAKAVAEGLIEFLKLKKKPLSPKKSLDDWAKEVIIGKHGNGHTNREKSLKKSGCDYSYVEVRARVNKLLKY
jgi:N-acetylmuramoyl-L-alanine amidase